MAKKKEEIKDKNIKRKKTQKQFMSQMKDMFSLATVNVNSKGRTAKTIAPGEKKTTPKGNKVIKPIDFPGPLQAAFETFSQSVYPIGQTSAYKNIRYDDLESMSKNSGIMSSSLNYYVSEAFEMKEGQRPITLVGKSPEVEKVFNKWLTDIGFNDSVLQDICYNLTLFGDSFLMNTIDPEFGVTKITPIDVRMILDKLVFNFAYMNKMENWNKNILNLTNKNKVIKDVYEWVTNTETANQDYAKYFESYELGYLLAVGEKESIGIPPWAVTHFKRFSSQSEFFPFGIPTFMGSIAPYKSYLTTQMLTDMARVESFPREVYEIGTTDSMTAMDKYDRVNEVREMIEGLHASDSKNNDESTIGKREFTVDGLWKYRLEQSGIDPDRLFDLEQKRKDLIASTGLTEDVIWSGVKSNGGNLGGSSAKAIMYQDKKFQRKVEGTKVAVLDGLDQLFRIHLTVTGQFEKEETEFELSMPVNSEMFDSDKIRQTQDLMRTASDFLTNLGTAVGLDRGEALSVPLVKDVFKYFMDVDDNTLDKWFKKYEDSTKPVKESRIKELTERLTDKVVREAYFKTKRNNGTTNTKLCGKIVINRSYDTDIVKEGGVFAMLKTQMGLDGEDSFGVHRISEKEMKKIKEEAKKLDKKNKKYKVN